METEFQKVRRIMSEPIRPPDPLTDAEIEALMQQPTLSETDFPNAGYQLPANEFPSDDNNENQTELQLNYHEH